MWKYAQTGLLETDCEVYLEQYLIIDHGSHIDLDQEGKISNTVAVIQCIEQLYMPYNLSYVWWRRKLKESKVRILTFNFPNYVEGHWNPGSSFYNKGAKDFCL